jgi:hypothetical protein
MARARPCRRDAAAGQSGLAGPLPDRYPPHPFSVFIRVTPFAGTKSAELSRRSRFLAAIAGAGLLAALLLASQLRPDPRGRGTHEQLGLPPCTFTWLFDRPCPACGMTTSWSLAMHGRLSDAVRTHASGTLLAAVALVAGLATIGVAARGRTWSWLPGETAVALVALVLAGLVLVEWILRLLVQAR